MMLQHAAQGQTHAIRALLASGTVDVNAPNPFGQTPVMLAVRGGHLDTAVQLALSGADLSLRDTSGRTALQIAIENSSREASLALLLIATAKFTKPLSYMLPLPLLSRLQRWLTDTHAKNASAVSMVKLQYLAWLQHTRAESGTASQSAYADERNAAIVGLIGMLVWAARRALTELCDRIGRCFVSHVNPPELTCARDAYGHTALHAMVLAGQLDSCRALTSALSPAETLAMLRLRNAAGRRAHEMGRDGVPPQLQTACDLAARHVAELLAALEPREDGAAPTADVPSPTTPAAAFDLLQLAGVSLSDRGQQPAAPAAPAAPTPPCRGRPGAGSRHRAARPHLRPGVATKPSASITKARKMGKDCWLPGGLWWQDAARLPLPPGRQPGELAGWSPLVDVNLQRMMHEQKAALERKEKLVQARTYVV